MYAVGMRCLIDRHHSIISIHLRGVLPGADWGQKASTAIGFMKATETLRKKPHITLKSLCSTKNVIKSLAILEKASISLKKSSKIVEIFIKAPHF
jgi:hypothetical protein